MRFKDRYVLGKTQTCTLERFSELYRSIQRFCSISPFALRRPKPVSQSADFAKERFEADASVHEMRLLR